MSCDGEFFECALESEIGKFSTSWTVRIAVVCYVLPRGIKTPIRNRSEIIEEQGKLSPWGRLGTRQNIGRAAAFLSSGDADYTLPDPFWQLTVDFATRIAGWKTRSHCGKSDFLQSSRANEVSRWTPSAVTR